MWNKHQKLVAIWAGLDLLYLGSAAVCFAFVFAWRGLGPADLDDPSHILKRVVVADADAFAALALGSAIVLTFFLSLFAFFRTRAPGRSTSLLSLFNSALVIVIIATLAVGTLVWFWSLRQVAEYAQVFANLDPAIQRFVQDSLRCCGYYNATAEGMFTTSTGFCSSIEVLNDATLVTPCMKPLTAYSDNTLNNVFGTVYGMVVVQCCLFLATACLAVDKREEERFRKIEKKRGIGKGGIV